MNRTSRLIARLTACAMLAHPAAMASSEVSGQAPGSTKGQVADEEVGRILLERLRGFSGPKTLDEIVSGTSLDRQTAERVLRQLVADGKVMRSGKGSKASPFKYENRGAGG